MNNHFLVYLLEASICQLFFYFVYILFLKKETYFNLNRTYLLCSILLSLLIPSVQIKHEVIEPFVSGPLQTIVEPIQNVTNMVEDKIESRIDVLFILWIIYIVIAAIVSAKFIYQFFRLMLFIRKGEISVLNRHYLICTNGQYPTSSFFGYILWDNTVALSDKEIEQIIKHEMAHINQFHTLDNLLMELLGILFWFNPFVYLYNKKLKEVHEHIADNEVLNNKDFTSDDYEVLINKQILNNIGFQLSNNFNMSNLKTRIAMMTKTKSGKIATLKFLFAFPAALVMLFTFSLKQTVVIANNLAETINKQSENYPVVITTDGVVKIYKVPVKTLLDAGKLEVNVNDEQKSILSYTMLILHEGEMDISMGGAHGGFNSASAEFTERIKTFFKNEAKPGDRFLFTDIKVKEKDGSWAEIHDVTIEIEGDSKHKPSANNDILIPAPVSASTLEPVVKKKVEAIEYPANIHAIIAGNDFQIEKMSKGELLASGELQTDNRKYVLKSFRMTTKINGLVMVEDATNGVFTQQMRSMIKKVKSGGTIVFKEIQAQLFDDTDSDGAIVTLAGFTITIK